MLLIWIQVIYFWVDIGSTIWMLNNRNNVYKLRKRGATYTSIPFKRKISPKTSKVEGRIFLTITHTKHKFWDPTKESREVYILVVKDIWPNKEELTQSIPL